MRLGLVASLLCLCTVSLCLADPAKAAIRKDLNVPPESLSPALQQVATTYELQVLYPTQVAKDLKTHGAVGFFTPDDALKAVLSGTGLSYKYLDANTVTVFSTAAPAGAAAATGQDQTNTTQDNSKEAGKKSSQDFRVAQVDQAPAGDSTVEQKPPEKKKEKQPEQLEEVVVTGTYLHNTAPIAPVTTLTHDELVNQGYTRLDEVIAQLPQNFLGGASPASNPVNGIGNGSAQNYNYASGVNLRGLGAGATLVLLNGRRLAPTAYGGVTDISQIPVSIIDRVEILSDGASALYGSDAVAGVVNVITKRDYSGVEVGGRSTGITDGKAPNYGGNILGGFSWGTGGVVTSFDYEKDNPLFARNRSFTEALPNPWPLTPEMYASNYYLSAHNNFTDDLTLSLDALATDQRHETQAALPFAAGYTSSGRVEQYSTSLQLDYRISTDWTATLVGLAGKESDLLTLVYPNPPPGATYVETFAYRISTIEPRIDGKLFDTPGGTTRLALGAQFRDERFENDFVLGIVQPPVESSRHVSSAYGELLIPIVGANNAVPLVQELRVDISGRYDHYSDFGRTSNPKLGLEWVPTAGLTLHTTYARSFQAPTLYETSNAQNYGYVIRNPDPNSPSGTSLVFAIDGTNPNLQPETAKSYTAGFTLEPTAVTGLKIDASYFSIDFDNQINRLVNEGFFYNILPQAAALGSLVQFNPTAAQLNAQFNVPGRSYFNYAGPVGTYQSAPYQLSDITAIADIGYVNAASVKVQGIDLSARYIGVDTSVGKFRADVDGSYFLKYDQRQTPGAQPVSGVNNLFQPLRFRAKANLGWERNGWGANVRVNFSNAYGGTGDPNCLTAPNCSVSSWTTVDLGVSYSTHVDNSRSWLNGVRIAVVATNVFDRDPPFVPPLSSSGYGYDPLNANPLLRTFSITFTKRWGGP